MSPDPAARYAGQSVPRYTSYPTAADFSAAVGPAEYRSWLSALPLGEAVSIYLHVPYCRQLCHYCGCHAKVARRDHVIETYRRHLVAEIGLVADALPGRIPAARIAWGGGTPSILGPEGLADVHAALAQAFDFGALVEHAIELDPRQVTPLLCDGLARMGVNRASLGVQDTDPAVQEAIGRLQPMETVATAVSMLRGVGISRINMDLIYGLPGQSVESLDATCQAVAALSPDRIACYGYAHLPERRANQRLIDAARLPGPTERLKLHDTVSARLAHFGYVPIGIDHFARFCDPLAKAARSGRLHRNFQGYTDDDRPTLIGLGASAISQLPGGFAQSEPEIGAYGRSIAGGTLATRRGHALGLDDRRRAAIIEALMCNFRADLGSLASGFADEMALLRPFVLDGLVEIADGVIAVTRAGRPFVRLVSAVFDRFRLEATRRFSGAV